MFYISILSGKVYKKLKEYGESIKVMDMLTHDIRMYDKSMLIKVSVN
jgi:hypothetical protein